MTDYEPVIGLEVHAQLKTRTKIFCACSTRYGAPPNSQTCEVCLGHPGALPVLNRRAVELAVRGAVALGAEVRLRSVFERKNYFYPDLPKGYQISQYREPLATGGAVQIEVEGRSRTVGLTRLHIEEDAGKSIHDEGEADTERFSRVDLNRAGVPLVEIVSRPELHSPAEAYLFLERLRSTLRYVDVCEGAMEQGSLRCDANVSLRPMGSDGLGTRTEVKNLNSFRNVQRALEFEISRQREVLASAGSVEQETVLWDAATGRTRTLRGKEEAEDYRYFPEPDLPPLALDPAWIREIAEQLGELPAERKRRFTEEHALSDQEAHLLTLEPELASFYEEVASRSGNPKAAANFVLNDLLRAQREAGREPIRIRAADLAELISLVDEGTISVSVARQDLFPALARGETGPRALVRERGLAQMSDEAQLDGLVREVLAENPSQLEQYHGGKTGLFAYFVGLVMRRSGGTANPRVVGEVLKRQLERDRS